MPIKQGKPWIMKTYLFHQSKILNLLLISSRIIMNSKNITMIERLVSSFDVCDKSKLEFLLFLRVFFTRKIDSISSIMTSILFIKTRISDDTFSSEHSCSNSFFRRSTSSRTLFLLIVAMVKVYHSFFQPPQTSYNPLSQGDSANMVKQAMFSLINPLLGAVH